MKLLVTGAQGMLGFALQEQCRLQKIPVIPVGKQECDVTNFAQLQKVIQKHQPTHIINAAAYTKVDLAETEREIAQAINADGAKYLAEICWSEHIKLLHLSTDYVFDGKNEQPYLENSPINPLSVYGKTKAQGEIWVQEKHPDALIIRLQALYGENGSHFVQTMLNLSQKYPEVQVVNDQFTSPSYTKHIAKSLLDLLNVSASGIFHLHNQGSCSWYEFAREIFLLTNNPTKVIPVSSEKFSRPAPRPLNSQLAMNKWKQQNLPPIPHWKEALQEYINHNYRIEIT